MGRCRTCYMIQITIQLDIKVSIIIDITWSGLIGGHEGRQYNTRVKCDVPCAASLKHTNSCKTHVKIQQTNFFLAFMIIIASTKEDEDCDSLLNRRSLLLVLREVLRRVHA